MLKRVSLLVALVLCVGCASPGGPRHIAVVTVATGHSTVAAIQDTEALVVCDVPGAPPAPQCLTPEQHHAFAAKLVTAFDVDGKMLRRVRAWPAGQPLPPEITNLLTQLKALVKELLALLPAAPQTDRLMLSLGGAK